jgi:hypothetical protein
MVDIFGARIARTRAVIDVIVGAINVDDLECGGELTLVAAKPIINCQFGMFG